MVVGECARIWQVQSVMQAPRLVIARRPQADVAISGRHCPSERAIVKTATAPDLSLRGGAADVAISGRHCPSERAIVKTATAPDLSLRGGAADVAISGRHFQFVQGTDKNVPTNCVCSGAHCAAVGGFAALRMRRAPCG